jgi:serine/threonine protein kinase
MFDSYKKAALTVNSTYSSTSDEIDWKQNQMLPFLHIQMDLCSFTLKDAMIKVNDELKIKQDEILNQLGYYIAGELLIEILQSIDFLHKHDPTIIHRDLKPQNILISTVSNGRFVKISDFGLATEHSGEDSHTKLAGTISYMAPEVMTGRNYNTKADIYSLGLIIQEIFNISINT